MRPDSPLGRFNPERLAHFEKEKYIAYYKKDWLLLLRGTIEVVSETFALIPPQAVYSAYLLAQADIAFQPAPNNDIPKTENYIRRFYQLIKSVHGEEFEVARATKFELSAWIVHRKLFANPQNDELAQAFQALYAEVYGMDPERLREAAALRAQGILYSDLWVKAGRSRRSPLLRQEEEALAQSYRALKKALA